MIEGTFTVEGMGEFPLDMLRYDRAWPERVEDCIAIKWGARAPDGLQSVTLRTASRTAPTRERWRSFGWNVI